jgi:hypothetical protein
MQFLFLFNINLYTQKLISAVADTQVVYELNIRQQASTHNERCLAYKEMIFLQELLTIQLLPDEIMTAWMTRNQAAFFLFLLGTDLNKCTYYYEI